MKPQTLAMAADLQSGFEHYRQPTRDAEFLKTMQAIVPCSALCEVIEPHDPKAAKAQDFTNQRTRRAGASVDEVQRGKKRNHSKIRARVDISLACASGCGALPRYAGVVCGRMPCRRSRPWRGPISISADKG